MQRIGYEIRFTNGKAKCGCTASFSSGNGEYSDCITVFSCPDHGGAPKAEIDWIGPDLMTTFPNASRRG